MTGSELYNMLHYKGMVRDLRGLALGAKIINVHTLATMTTEEVCNVIAKYYEVVATAKEEISLVRKEDLEDYNTMIERYVNKLKR